VGVCIKLPKILEIGQRVRPCKATLHQKVEIVDISGTHSPCADLGEILHSQAEPDARRFCQV